MERKLHRAIKIINGIKYEYIGPDSYIPEDAEKIDLDQKYIFDWCVKESFNNSHYFGEVCSEKPEYGRIIKLKGIKNSDLYFSENMHLENKMSDKILERYIPKKSHKTTSGDEINSGNFFSVASSSRFAVTSFTETKKGTLDYIGEIKINDNLEKILDIEFEHDTPVKGINSNSRCPQLDVYFKTKAGTYFVEVKNHEILDCYKSIELSPSYMSTEPFKKLGLKQELNVKNKKDKYGNNTDDTFISLKGNLEKNRFLLSSDFGCELDTHHFDFKQFLCHLMGIYSYAMNHKDEQVFFYYLIYKNELYENEYDSKLYTELEKEIKIVFDVFGKRFPHIHFGLCYNNKYDTLGEIRNIF